MITSCLAVVHKQIFGSDTIRRTLFLPVRLAGQLAGLPASCPSDRSNGWPPCCSPLGLTGQLAALHTNAMPFIWDLSLLSRNESDGAVSFNYESVKRFFSFSRHLQNRVIFPRSFSNCSCSNRCGCRCFLRRSGWIGIRTLAVNWRQCSEPASWSHARVGTF